MSTNDRVPEPDRRTWGVPLPDLALAVALAVFGVVGTYAASQQGQPLRRPFDAGAAALVIVAALALTWRRRYPVPVLAVVFGVTLGYFVIGYRDGPIWFPLIIAYFTAVFRGYRAPAAVLGLAGFLLFPWLDFLLRDGRAPSGIALLALAAWLLVLFGAAEFGRTRRERREEASRMREEAALRRAGEERLRIARELHDALGHHLSLINVQSSVALHLNEQLPDQARTSLVAIKDASKDALTELRSVLDILRQEGDAAPRLPGSTLARIEDLASQARAAGIQVRTETQGHVRAAPYAVEAAAFRIVQEALTNVTRHAGQATATVRLAYGERDLTVEIEDDGRGASAGGSASSAAAAGGVAEGGGKGIVGMRERVGALHGELEAGPRPEGGFRVFARIPLNARDT
jgi:signal transduction histidine kinase